MSSMAAKTEAKQTRTLPLLPLKNAVVFPHVLVPLAVGRPRSLALIEQLPAGDRLLAMSAQIDEDVEEAGWDRALPAWRAAADSDQHRGPAAPRLLHRQPRQAGDRPAPGNPGAAHGARQAGAAARPHGARAGGSRAWPEDPDQGRRADGQ